MPPKIQCPSCKKSLEWSDQFPSRPFCSQRCKDIDLGAWASDAYAIEGSPPASPEEAESFHQAANQYLQSNNTIQP